MKLQKQKMMNSIEIEAVSPLKARQSSRGGKSAGRATSTGKRRGGFAKSSGKRGAGGRNVGGYNVNTRFSSSKWTPPPSGGTFRYGSDAPAAQKPYSFTPEGKMKVNPTATQKQKQSQTQGTPGSGYYKDIYEDRTTTTGGLEGYKTVWDKNADDLQGKYTGDFKKFTAAADKWWEEEATEEEKQKRNKTTKTDRVKIGQEWIQTSEPTAGTQTQSQSQTTN